jgi:hypothetical protein
MTAAAQATVTVTVTIPRHSSVVDVVSKCSNVPDDDDEEEEEKSSISTMSLLCYRPQVLWHGLYPLLFAEDHPTKLTQQQQQQQALLFILFQHSYQHSTSFRSFLSRILIPHKENNDPEATASATAKSINNRRRKPSNGSRVQEKQGVLDRDDLFYRRDVTLAVPTLNNNNSNSNKLLFRPIRRHRHVNASHRFRLYVLPAPPRQSLDKTFAGLVLRHERTLLQKQTLTAWMATLGGGYFFCKQLSKSLRLARQQRSVASQIGNESMVRHCLLNEAYNLIYAGSFSEAKTVLSTLERTVVSKRASSRTTQILEEHDVERTLRQCDAARTFMRRLKKLSPRLSKYRIDGSTETHTKDDYQRVRIVEVSSSSSS